MRSHRLRVRVDGAFIIRVCAPHGKHADIACRISASVAFGLRSRNALAVMMTPLTQKPHCIACSSMNAF